jgi:hypothetical protein
MTTADLESRLRGAGVSDVLLPGFIDDEVQPHQFRALPQAIYFECNSSLLKFERIATTGTMHVSLVDNVSSSADLDDDMVPAIASLREQVLDDADGSNLLLEIRLWNLAEDEDGLRCAAAQLKLANGQQIFVDPTYHFGIRVGRTRQRDIWSDTWPAAKSAHEHVVELALRSD